VTVFRASRDAGAPRAAPHSPQKRARSALLAPQVGHRCTGTAYEGCGPFRCTRPTRAIARSGDSDLVAHGDERLVAEEVVDDNP